MGCLNKHRYSMPCAMEVKSLRCLAHTRMWSIKARNPWSPPPSFSIASFRGMSLMLILRNISCRCSFPMVGGTLKAAAASSSHWKGGNDSEDTTLVEVDDDSAEVHKSVLINRSMSSIVSTGNCKGCTSAVWSLLGGGGGWSYDDTARSPWGAMKVVRPSDSK